MEQWKNTLLARKDWVDEFVESEEAYWRVAGKALVVAAEIVPGAIPLILHGQQEDSKEAELGRPLTITRGRFRFPRSERGPDEARTLLKHSSNLENFRKALKENFINDDEVKNAVWHIREEKEPIDKFTVRCGSKITTSIRIDPIKSHKLEMDLNANKPDEIKHALLIAEYWKQHRAVPKEAWLNDREIKFNIHDLASARAILDQTPMDVEIRGDKTVMAIEVPKDSSQLGTLRDNLKSHQGKDLVLARYHEDLDPDGVQIWKSGNSDWESYMFPSHSAMGTKPYTDCMHLAQRNRAYCLVLVGEEAENLHKSPSTHEEAKASEAKGRHSTEEIRTAKKPISEHQASASSPPGR